MKLNILFKNLALVAITLAFTQCSSDDSDLVISEHFPTTFKVDIPTSISKTSSQKSTNSDDYSGQEIYEHLNNFISVGESAAEFVEEIMKGISIYGLDEPMDFDFISNDDGRTKHIVVVDVSEFEGKTWQHQLTITDVENAGNDDAGIALQVFWSTQPVRGIAILKPQNWNVNANEMLNTIFKIEYSVAGEYGYDEHMIVSITNWEENYSDRFHMEELKMFVGKTGNEIDVFGNSIHPDAYLFLEEPKGFCWAFVASANDDSNIAVAEVGLPPHMLDESARSVLLEDYSIENVFTEQINEWVFDNWGVYPDDATIAEYLVNTQAPGYFNADGFVQGGEAPTDNYIPLENNIKLLTPYNPLTVSELNIHFK